MKNLFIFCFICSLECSTQKSFGALNPSSSIKIVWFILSTLPSKFASQWLTSQNVHLVQLFQLSVCPSWLLNHHLFSSSLVARQTHRFNTERPMAATVSQNKLQSTLIVPFFSSLVGKQNRENHASNFVPRSCTAKTRKVKSMLGWV